jgi:hypothetical protein
MIQVAENFDILSPDFKQQILLKGAEESRLDHRAATNFNKFLKYKYHEFIKDQLTKENERHDIQSENKVQKIKRYTSEGQPI